MGRPKRIILPGFPHHIVQRGHNRRNVFDHPTDYRRYLTLLEETHKDVPCKIFAFCLMTNHVHLILDPGTQPQNLSLFMQTVTSKYSAQYNSLHGRTGTLWEGRFKSSPIETDAYLLVCSRYVELNPVRAGLVSAPEAYPYSSYRHKAGIERISWLDTDPCFMALGVDAPTREVAYQKWTVDSDEDEHLKFVRNAIKKEIILGTSDFKCQLASHSSFIKRKRF